MALAAFACAVAFLAAPGSALAGLHNAIPFDANEDPADLFNDNDALFAYTTSDIKGGYVCAVHVNTPPRRRLRRGLGEDARRRNRLVDRPDRVRRRPARRELAARDRRQRGGERRGRRRVHRRGVPALRQLDLGGGRRQGEGGGARHVHRARHRLCRAARSRTWASPAGRSLPRVARSRSSASARATTPAVSASSRPPPGRAWAASCSGSSCRVSATRVRRRRSRSCAS